MKTSRKSLRSQRAVIQSKLQPWQAIRADQAPGSGWIKAVRGALGMSARQLAERLGVQQSTVTRIEKREAAGDVTLNVLRRVAEAMNCKLTYAIVPDDRHADLDAIVDARAQSVARELVGRNEHSMRLEKQGTDDAALKRQIDALATELTNSGSRLWKPTGTQRR